MRLIVTQPHAMRWYYRRMPPKRALFALLLLWSIQSLGAQWITYPVPGIPRTKDGKPDLNAPAPKTPDGKPDLSGMWSPYRTLELAAAGDKLAMFGGNRVRQRHRN